MANYVVYSTNAGAPETVFMNFVNILIYDNNGKTALNTSVLILVMIIYLLTVVFVIVTVKLFCCRRQRKDPEEVENLNNEESAPNTS